MSLFKLDIEFIPYCETHSKFTYIIPDILYKFVIMLHVCRQMVSFNLLQFVLFRTT